MAHISARHKTSPGEETGLEGHQESWINSSVASSAAGFLHENHITHHNLEYTNILIAQ